MTEVLPNILNFGVDSLWINYAYADEDGAPLFTPLSQAVLQRLMPYQEAAREADQPVPTDLEFRGSTLFMYPGGGGPRSPWRFLLRCRDLEVKIGTGRKTGFVAKVRFLASYLWVEQQEPEGLRQAMAEVYVFLGGCIFNALLYAQVSEVHLCADLCFDFARALWQEGFIRRAGLHPHFDRDVHFVDAQSEEEASYLPGPDDIHCRFRPITGYSFGTHKSPLSAVIYNKSLYIRTREKEASYFEDLWRANGYDGSADVWRVEFRFKRDVLREFKIDEVCHGIDAADDLPDCLEVMWQYCTVHWLRYVIPDSHNKNQSRWLTHPAWRVVQEAFFPLVRIDLAPVVRERRYTVNESRMVAQLTGCLMTYYAWLKAQEPCVDEDISGALHRLYPAALDYLERTNQEFNAGVRSKQVRYYLLPASAA